MGWSFGHQRLARARGDRQRQGPASALRVAGGGDRRARGQGEIPVVGDLGVAGHRILGRDGGVVRQTTR